MPRGNPHVRGTRPGHATNQRLFSAIRLLLNEQAKTCDYETQQETQVITRAYSLKQTHTPSSVAEVKNHRFMALITSLRHAPPQDDHHKTKA